jgi:hypothetical protein
MRAYYGVRTLWIRNVFIVQAPALPAKGGSSSFFRGVFTKHFRFLMFSGLMVIFKSSEVTFESYFQYYFALQDAETLIQLNPQSLPGKI